jgi:outer membrane protein assembly factor BamB
LLNTNSGERKMQTLKNKTMAILIAIFLTLSMSASTMLMPTVSSHTPPWTVPTYTYVSVSPNPVGVGQTVNVNFWVNIPPPTQIGVYGDRWQNLTVVVTKPDGSKTTLGPYPSDATGGTFTTYTPAATGNYTFQSFFGGQTLTNANPAPGVAPNIAVNDTYLPSKSTVFTLTVQQEAIPGVFVNPLPSTYWTRPIYAENTNWYSIAGNWLGAGVYNATGYYNPYTTAPTTGHILWTKPEAFGGTIGGEFGSSEQSNFYSTRQYEAMFAPIIMNGILYYTQYPGSATYPEGNVAVDLRTGQTLWTSNSPLTLPNSPYTPATVSTAGPCTILKCGQILNYVSPNQYGGLAYLWSTGTPAMVASATNIGAGTTTYNMFDAKTGNYILSIVNGTAFSAVTEDDSGDLICYYINASTANAYHAPTLVEWNSTKALLKYGYDTFVLLGLQVWRPPQGGIIPFSDGIQWTMPIATNISGAPITLGYSGISSGVILMDQYSTTGGAIAFQDGWIIEAGYSSDTGQLLWGPVNRTENVGTRVAFGTTGNGNAGFAIGDGAWVECDLNALTVTGYNLLTGVQLWGPEAFPDANQWDSLGMQEIVADGSVYIWGLGGDVYSINIANGKVNWHYHTPDGGVDSPYGIEPLWPSTGKGVVAGGILFVPEGHEFAPPLFHGAQQLALNISNGQVIWSIEAFNVNAAHAVADGIMVAINAYDNQIYGYGQGPSATTVNAPQLGVTTATPVTITGTVTDISAGSKQQAVAANFPNGLPCVSDQSMSQFMEAVYMQQIMPNNITGVPVTLSVIDSNNNYRQIGSTTTNAMGTFGLTWTPDIPGGYTIIATFAGSGSYYGSSAQTYFYASAVEPTQAPTATPLSGIATQTTFMYGVIAIIIVIIVGIAVLGILMQRKRP